METNQGWFARLFSPKDRRRAERKATSEMAAYFWTGSQPVRHEVRDISATGMYLVTDQRWSPGTVLMMTLQESSKGPEPALSISVQSKAVRVGDDGVGLTFLLPKEEKKYFAGGREGADAGGFSSFLDRFWKRSRS